MCQILMDLDLIKALAYFACVRGNINGEIERRNSEGLDRQRGGPAAGTVDCVGGTVVKGSTVLRGKATVASKGESFEDRRTKEEVLQARCYLLLNISDVFTICQ